MIEKNNFEKEKKWKNSKRNFFKNIKFLFYFLNPKEKKMLALWSQNM